MAPNPFITDRPLAPSELINREQEAAELLRHVEGGHNSRLSAPRRYGKTTLLGRLRRDAEDLGMTSVAVDFFGVVSPQEVAARIEEAYRRDLQGPLGRWFAGAVRTWRPTVSAGPVGLALQSEADNTRLLDKLLDLPAGIFTRTGQRTLVVFDEFQDLLAAGDKVDGLLRSRIQRHRDEASYVFAGSHPGLMAELFGDRDRPFFGQARPVELGPLPNPALAEFVGDQFERTGRDVGEALEPLLDLVRGHPQRAMLAAHHLWDLTPSGQAADIEAWARAFEGVLVELQEGFERMWQAYSTNQRRVLAAVAWTGPFGAGQSLFSRDTLARFKLSKGSTQDVRDSLMLTGELQRDGLGAPELVDPLLEAWIASGRRPISP